MTFLQAQGILSSYHCINVFVLWLGLFGVLYLYIPFSLLLVRLSDHFPLMKWHNFSLFLSFFCERAVCSKPDDPEETSWPPEARRLLPGRQQDDLSEPGGVFRPRVAKPASGGVVSHQPRLHRLRGAGQCPALQEAHRGPALPAAAVARWLVYFSFYLKSVNATSSPILKERILFVLFELNPKCLHQLRSSAVQRAALLWNPRVSTPGTSPADSHWPPSVGPAGMKLSSSTAWPSPKP